MISDASASRLLPSQEETKTPVRKMKPMDVMKPRPNTLKPNSPCKKTRFCKAWSSSLKAVVYEGASPRALKKGLITWSKKVTNHHATYTVTHSGKSTTLRAAWHAPASRGGGRGGGGLRRGTRQPDANFLLK